MHALLCRTINSHSPLGAKAKTHVWLRGSPDGELIFGPMPNLWPPRSLLNRMRRLNKLFRIRPQLNLPRTTCLEQAVKHLPTSGRASGAGGATRLINFFGSFKTRRRTASFSMLGEPYQGVESTPIPPSPAFFKPSGGSKRACDLFIR